MDGKVIVNGQALVENYVPPEFRDQSSMSERMVPEDRILRAGRSSQLVQRQPRLGHGPAPVYLRQGRIHLLASG